MSTELVVTPAPVPPSLATILGVQPREMMAYAIEISETLTRVLREKGLTQRFGPNEHVRVEGWELAGSLLGLTVDEISVEGDADGSYTAVVALKNPTTERQLAKASGYCGVDESSWARKPKYARRSMALTRAVGRVYRQNFAWLIKLAGFEPTPAEEMTDVDIQPARETAAAPTSSPAKEPETYTGTPDQEKRLAAILEHRSLAGNLWEAVGEAMKGKPMTKTAVQTAVEYVLVDAAGI